MKKTLFFLFTLTLVSLTSVSAFAKINEKFDISKASVEITESGVYEIIGETTENNIVVDGKEINVVLILNDVSIVLEGKKSPIDIGNANVTIVMTGKNYSVVSSLKDVPAIHVGEKATLTFNDYDDGEESFESTELKVYAAKEAQGIGENRVDAIAGAIRFYSGTVLVEVEADGLGAIGSGYGLAKEITIDRKAVVYAYSASSEAIPTIGTGSDKLTAATSINIAGGYLYAENKGEGVAIGYSAINNGVSPFINGVVSISGGTIEAVAKRNTAVSAINQSYPPEIIITGGSIRTIVPSGIKGVGGVDPSQPVNANGEQVVQFIVMGGKPDHSVESTFSVTVDGQPYAYTYTGKGHLSDSESVNQGAGETDSLYFYIVPSTQVVASTDNGSTTFSGAYIGISFNDVFSMPSYLKKDLQGSVTLDLSLGSITFTTSGVSGYDEREVLVEGGYGEYIIVQSGQEEERNYIDVQSGAHTITLGGINITNGEYGLKIAPESAVDLGWNCNNSIIAEKPINVPEKAYLTIKGGDSQTTFTTLHTSAYPAIGGNPDEVSGLVVVESGSFRAEGGLGAGIGGGQDGTGYVSIKGGNFEAVSAGGAGIGGGENGYGDIEIYDGEIRALSECGAGIGGGKEGQARVLINNGKIYAYSEDGAGIGYGQNAGRNINNGGIYVINGTIDAISLHGAGIGGGNGDSAMHMGGPSTQVRNGSVYTKTEEGNVVPSMRPEPTYGNYLYYSVIPGAMAPTTSSIYGANRGEAVTFNTTKASQPSFSYSYSGEGHEDTYDLFFYLPPGEGYTVTGSNGKTYTGTVTSAGGIFNIVPEPGMLALLALVALCFRRK
ncbi:hypothetical protein J6U78_00595 [bacterium]|nr:hypothetical protein [bacterium]